MKRNYNLAILLCSLALTGCNEAMDELTNDSTIRKKENSYSTTRSIEDAYSYAKEAAALLDDGEQSRQTTIREIEPSKIRYLVNENSRSNPDTIFYIINYNDSLGYAIISAKTATEPIIAVTEKGIYDESSTTNPGMSLFIDMAKDYVLEKSGLPITPTNPGLPITETKHETVVLKDENVAPRITVNWGQGGIYGAECPNGISGCSITALGQAMTYFSYPNSIKLNYSGGSTLTLNWNNIKKHISGTSSSASCCSSSTHSEISKLLRQIGYDAKSSYGNGATGTVASNLRNAVIKYGFNAGTITDYSSYCIPSHLGNGIILIRGEHKGNNEEVGHMWVADGYKYKKQQLNMYTRPQNSTTWTLFSSEIQIYSYNHFNWGWNGLDNGYFNENVFKTSSKDFKYNVRYFTINR